MVTVPERRAGIGRTSGARNAEVAAIMEEAVRENECPFCPKMFARHNADRVVDVGQMGPSPSSWNIFKSRSPFDGTRVHIMLATKFHVNDIDELSDDGWAELKDMIQRLKRLFGFVSYSLVSRLGDMRYNSATVDHLHVHIVVSDAKPADPAVIPEEYRSIIPHVLELLPEHPKGQLEALDRLREALDVWREAQRGKAQPIRAKLSNETGVNNVEES